MVGCSIDDGSKPINCESSPVTKLGLELLTENGSAEVKQKEVLFGSDSLVIATTGQRKYGGLPLNCIDPPSCGSEVIQAIHVTLNIMYNFSFVCSTCSRN
jgi:hypothetical protein